MDNFSRAIAFVLEHEGGFQNIASDKGNWTGGAVGKGELKGTKYGISAASYPKLDIANLTLETAREIYKRDYWERSGADELAWPLCLVVMDTAALHGAATAQVWLAEVGPNALVLAAKRLRSYTNMSGWPTSGIGWVRRVADLLMAIQEA